MNGNARAGFIGLSAAHRFPDLVRAVVEGLAMAARDCYAAMGDMPAEVRLTGGAARSRALRAALSAAVGAPVRASTREEAGAAGAAMMAAVAIGLHPTMDACIAEWVTPLLGTSEAPDAELMRTYAVDVSGLSQRPPRAGAGVGHDGARSGLAHRRHCARSEAIQWRRRCKRWNGLLRSSRSSQ